MWYFSHLDCPYEYLPDEFIHERSRFTNWWMFVVGWKLHYRLTKEYLIELWNHFYRLANDKQNRDCNDGDSETTLLLIVFVLQTFVSTFQTSIAFIKRATMK